MDMLYERLKHLSLDTRLSTLLVVDQAIGLSCELVAFPASHATLLRFWHRVHRNTPYVLGQLADFLEIMRVDREFNSSD